MSRDDPVAAAMEKKQPLPNPGNSFASSNVFEYKPHPFYTIYLFLFGGDWYADQWVFKQREFPGFARVIHEGKPPLHAELEYQFSITTLKLHSPATYLSRMRVLFLNLKPNSTRSFDLEYYCNSSSFEFPEFLLMCLGLNEELISPGHHLE